MKIKAECCVCKCTLQITGNPDDMMLLVAMGGTPPLAICIRCAQLPIETIRKAFDISSR